MCRYAMTTYKPHYACFKCRKTFKRRLIHDLDKDDKESVEAKCPQCGQLMANMGLDFASPKMDNIKEWAHIKDLYTVGITFHSCGCTGPGYIPKTKEKLIEHLESLKSNFNRNLNFWQQRVEPTNSREKDRDKSKNWNFIRIMPDEVVDRKGTVLNEDAKQYWRDRIKQIDLNLDKLR